MVDRATALAGGLYLAVGVLGALQFLGGKTGGGGGGGVAGNILNNYAADDGLITLGRAGLSLTVSIGIALMVHPLRGACRRLRQTLTVHPAHSQLLPLKSAAPPAPPPEHSPLSAAFAHTGAACAAGAPFGAAAAQPAEGGSAPAGGGSGGGGGASGGGCGGRELLEAVLIQASGLLAAVYIPEITSVWSFLGSTVCMQIGYVLPAACYLALRRSDGHAHLRAETHAHDCAGAWALAVGGSALTVLCTSSTLSQFFSSWR